MPEGVESAERFGQEVLVGKADDWGWKPIRNPSMMHSYSLFCRAWKLWAPHLTCIGAQM
jgi:hypothetical protein